MSVDQSTMNQADVEESGIQKHIRYWDKKNKGYITPIDAIYGFMSLGYSVIFSVALAGYQIPSVALL
ncbi:hypothetical protein RMCBS344292_12540 [Rhizopus microsporus]|nr:hypothetical protein RMCBS344292_12540 [Rhizopus microsporus]